MSKQLKSHFGKMLLAAKTGTLEEQEWFDPEVGICDNLENLIDLSESTRPSISSRKKALNLGFKTWEYFSGSLIYPVPSSIENVSAEDCFLEHDLWTGEQLNYRISLLQHIISVL